MWPKTRRGLLALQQEPPDSKQKLATLKQESPLLKQALRESKAPPAAQATKNPIPFQAHVSSP